MINHITAVSTTRIYDKTSPVTQLLVTPQSNEMMKDGHGGRLTKRRGGVRADAPHLSRARRRICHRRQSCQRAGWRRWGVACAATRQRPWQRRTTDRERHPGTYTHCTVNSRLRGKTTHLHFTNKRNQPRLVFCLVSETYSQQLNTKTAPGIRPAPFPSPAS